MLSTSNPAVVLENWGNDRNKVWLVALVDVIGRVMVSKMALLAYLVMVACLMTSVFVGYEWIASTSRPRVSVYVPAHTKVANRTAKAKLAADRARLASASTGEAASEPDLTIVNSAAAPPAETAKEESPSERRTARVHRKHPKIIVQRSPDGTVLGYADARELRSSANLDRFNPW
jgi:hypothetical protein